MEKRDEAEGMVFDSKMLLENESLLNLLKSADIETSRRVVDQLKKFGIPRYLVAPIYVGWDITYRCNFRCIHCYLACSRHSVNELTREELFDIADQIVRMKIFSVSFSGGEPLLRWKDLIALVRYFAEHGVGVSMVTNGWYVTEKRAKELAKYIGQVEISIDGSRAEVHEKVRGVPGSFERAVRAVRLFNEVNVETNIGTSLTRFNIEDFPNMIKLCKEIGVQGLITGHLYNSGRAFLNDVKPTKDQYEAVKRFIENYNANKSEKESPTVMFVDPTEVIRVTALLGLTTVVHITAHGFLVLHVLLPFEVGNLREQTLDEAWVEGVRVAWKHPKLRDAVPKIRYVDDVPLATAGHVYDVLDLMHLNLNEIAEENRER